jgi:CHAT domain-containing protein
VRERLLAAVQARIETGQLGPMLAEEAEAEVDQLLGLLAVPGGLDAQVAYAVGMFYLVRGHLRDADGEQDRLVGAIMLLPLLWSQPDALPEPVRSLLGSARETSEQLGDTPEQAMGRAFTDVAWLLLQRLVRLGEPDRDGLLAGLTELAAGMLPPGHEVRPWALCAHGYALLKAEQPADPNDRAALVDRLIVTFREAFQHMPAGDQHYARCACGLAAALVVKAERTNDRSMMAEAAGLFRIAADPASGGDEDLVRTAAEGARQAELRARPGGVLGLQYQILDQLEALRARLDESRAQLAEERARLDAPEEKLAELDESLARLDATRAESERIESEIREQLAKSEARLREKEKSVTPAPDDARSLEELLATLEELTGTDSRFADMVATRPGPFLDLRYIARSASRAFDQLNREFMLGPEHAGERSPWLSLPNPRPGPRPERTDLDEILALHERTMRELPSGGFDHGRLRATYLALSMHRLGDRNDPEARARQRELAGELPSLMQALTTSLSERFATRAQVQSQAAMGTAMSSPFQTVSEVNDAVARYRNQLDTMASDDPGRRSALTALANALFTRYLITSEDEAFQQAVDATRRTLAPELTPDPGLVFLWGLAAHLRDPSEEPAGGTEPGGVRGSGLAVFKIVQGDPEGALVSWETGRAGLLSSALTTRNEVDRLRAAEPRLAERFAALRGQLRVDSGFGADAAGPHQRDPLTREWHDLLERIRSRPGFDRFLLPPMLTFTDLAPAAAHGPVIALSVDAMRCDALVLRDDPDRSVVLVPLPQLRADELVEQTGAFRAAIDALSGPAAQADRLVRGMARQVVRDTLAWLWDVLAEPVLDAAGLAAHPGGDAPWPRVWWSPAGPLNFLPLHAAGRHDIPGASVLDRAVSSYTPTVRALLHSRARPAPAGEWTALAVAMPDTPGHAALPATVVEATAFATDFAGAASGRSALVGTAATRAAVCAALPGAAFAHFACHASSDPAEAETSHLLLHDGPLSVTELSRLRLDGAQLAYLSACATARGSIALADEAVHLASAFQLAGYAQAIGTLWEVDDLAAAHTAEQVHRELVRTTHRAARPPAALALHMVTRRMRAEYRADPWTWAAHVHAGA